VESKALLIVVLVLAALAAAGVLLARGLGEETAPAAEARASSQIEPGPSSAALAAASQGQPAPGSGGALNAQVQTPSVLLSPISVPSTRRVVATYFHNTARCVTCRSIERMAKETIDSVFAAEVLSGALVWRAINMEEKENEHYAIDYSLISPSLVLAEMDGEREVRFKVLDQVWGLVHKKAEFAPYVETEVRAFLEEP
jgi:hypothetical protein